MPGLPGLGGSGPEKNKGDDSVSLHYCRATGTWGAYVRDPERGGELRYLCALEELELTQDRAQSLRGEETTPDYYTKLQEAAPNSANEQAGLY